MSMHQNGESEESGPSSESPSKQECSDPESPFQGFRMPSVSVERIDLSPYLFDKTSTEPETPETGTVVIKKGILKAPSIDKYSLKCTVNLFRDNLKKIKDVFSKKTGTVTPNNFSPVGFQCNINEKLSPNNYVPDTSKPKKTVSFSEIVTVIEVREYYKCKKCPRIYYTRKALKRHLKKTHKKKQKFICNFCEIQFIDRMFFKVHMKLHCDVCGLLLPSRAKCLEHRRTVCRTLHKCPSCDCTFFRQKDLRDHNYDHVDPCFICDTCKDKFDTKCATAHHIRFLHSKRRPKAMYEIEKVGVERLFLCNFCDESNVDKDVIEEHQIRLPDLSNRIMKGTRDYYFCDQCKKKFKTEKQMLDHKWSHFLSSNDKSHTSPKADNDNTPDNSETQSNKPRKMFVTHNVTLNNAQDESNDSLAEKSVSPLNFEKENIESNNNSNSKDIHTFSLIDLLNSKSTPPPFLSKSKNVTDIQRFYKMDEVPEIMFKPKVVLKRCKINGEDVTNELSIIDLKSHNVSEGKITKTSATNDMDMIVTNTSVTNDIDMIVTNTSVTNDIDMIVTNTSVTNDAGLAMNDVVKTPPATNNAKNTDNTTKDRNTPPLKRADSATSTNTIDLSTPLLKPVDSTSTAIPGGPLKRVDSATSKTAILGSNETDSQPSAEKRPRKTLVSKHQCTICGQYYSSGYCLRRHITAVHHDLESLQCRVCEETFVWPSLLFSHKCIRLNYPEMPFQDARPEIHFDNVQSLNPEEFDGMNIGEDVGVNDSCGVDFEIPEPIQQLGEVNGSNEKQTMLAQFLSRPQAPPNGLSQIPDCVDEFAHLPTLSSPGIISQLQMPFGRPLPQIPQNNFTQNTSSQVPKQGFTQQMNGLNRPVHTVTRPNQYRIQQNDFVPNGTPQSQFVPNGTPQSRLVPNETLPNGVQQNHLIPYGTQQSQFVPNETQQNNQSRPILNSNLSSNLPIAQLERMGYKLVMEEVPIEF